MVLKVVSGFGGGGGGIAFSHTFVHLISWFVPALQQYWPCCGNSMRNTTVCRFYHEKYQHFSNIRLFLTYIVHSVPTVLYVHTFITTYVDSDLVLCTYVYVLHM
jgi:hypothetical protein